MRARLIVALGLAATAVAGCNQQGAAPAPTPAQTQAAPQPVGPPPVPADATAIRGRLTIPGLDTLPKGLQLHLRLLDVSDPSIVSPVVAEREEPAPASVPTSYALPYDPAAINEDGRYVLEATLTADDFVMYSTPKPLPVLTQGNGNSADLELNRGGPVASPDMAPADVMKNEFDKLEASIGGMKRLTGERIENKVTVGWDAFADDTGVRFAREVVDYGDAGKASYRYAYKNGQPWVIAREQGGVTTFVGWGEDGTLVLNRKGDNGPADDADVQKLRGMAEEAYKNASAKAG